MNEVLNAIYERRSVKKYTDRPVPAELLDEILKAGSFAANGKAWQAPVMVAVTAFSTSRPISQFTSGSHGM